MQFKFSFSSESTLALSSSPAQTLSHSQTLLSFPATRLLPVVPLPLHAQDVWQTSSPSPGQEAVTPPPSVAQTLDNTVSETCLITFFYSILDRSRIIKRSEAIISIIHVWLIQPWFINSQNSGPTSRHKTVGTGTFRTALSNQL